MRDFFSVDLYLVETKYSSVLAMAEECEGSIFAEDKKKRKRRGPRLTGVSKQRRLANARERKRVQSLNKEIEVLKSMLPLSPYEKKPTKTEVIWLAAEYIDELTKMLDKAQSEEEINEPLLDFDTLLSIDIEKLLDLDGKYTLNERPLVEKIGIVSAIVITKHLTLFLIVFLNFSGFSDLYPNTTNTSDWASQCLLFFFLNSNINSTLVLQTSILIPRMWDLVCRA